ncbi:hypothetical protein FKM82_025628 [Ascaphus truei]
MHMMRYTTLLEEQVNLPLILDSRFLCGICIVPALWSITQVSHLESWHGLVPHSVALLYSFLLSDASETLEVLISLFLRIDLLGVKRLDPMSFCAGGLGDWTSLFRLSNCSDFCPTQTWSLS